MLLIDSTRSALQSGAGDILRLTDKFVMTAQKLHPMLRRHKLQEDTARLTVIEDYMREVKDALNLDVELDELTSASK